MRLQNAAFAISVMAKAMSEIQRRIDRVIQSYEYALMNNTKWREVLELLATQRMPVQIAFVRDEEFKMQIIFPEGCCDGDHTLDCTVHGPFYLKEIFAIKCPRFQERMESKTGVKYLCDERYQLILKDLNSIGELPLKLNENDFVIYGYKK